MMGIHYKHMALVNRTAFGRLELQFQDEGIWKAELFKYVGKMVWVTVGKFAARRSKKQNSYYWSVVIKILAEEWGWEPEDLHFELRHRFLKEPDGPDGKPGRVKSTTELNKDEFWKEYIEKIQIWAAGFGINLPDPDKLAFDNDER